jgi:hypothetical protein
LEHCPLGIHDQEVFVEHDFLISSSLKSETILDHGFLISRSLTNETSFEHGFPISSSLKNKTTVRIVHVSMET